MAGDLAFSPLGGDCGVWRDEVAGVRLIVPGHPRVVAGALRAESEPTFDAALALGDLPVVFRYRRTLLPAAIDLVAFAGVFAFNRCNPAEVPRAVRASAAQLEAWNVAAGASALYALREIDADGLDAEEVLVLARAGALITITKRFSRAQVSWVSWALLSSAFAAGIHGGAGAVEEEPWPASTFLLPGVAGVLRAERRTTATRLAALAAPHPDACAALAAALPPLVRGAEAPSHVVSASERDAYAAHIGGAAAVPALVAEIRALLEEAHTAHDVRGIALLLLDAVGAQPARFDATNADAVAAFPHLQE